MIMTSLREADATLTVQGEGQSHDETEDDLGRSLDGSTRLGEVELVSSLAEYPFSSGIADALFRKFD
jgi:hypothetical protein